MIQKDKIQARLNTLVGQGWNWGYILCSIRNEFGVRIDCYNSGRLIAINGVKV